MLKFVSQECEMFDSDSSTFVHRPTVTIELEHSLLAISKWESKFEKPFLSSEKTSDEAYEYIKCMSLNDTFDLYPNLYLPSSDIQKINDYINAKMTATWFREDPNRRPNREIVTAEIIYYWMVALRIPFECENWHINRLLTLIRVCSEKQSKPKKVSRKQAMAEQRALNAQRKAKLHTRG